MGHRAEVGELLSPELGEQFMEIAVGLLQRMEDQQRRKVLKLAREAVPNISPEDMLNPHDFPQLKAHPTFEYEDGILAGIVSCKIAMRAEIRQRMKDDGPPPMP